MPVGKDTNFITKGGYYEMEYYTFAAFACRDGIVQYLRPVFSAEIPGRYLRFSISCGERQTEDRRGFPA